jgi:acyl carrier protein
VSPSTPFEERLAALWSEVLQLDRVGIHDHFLELGGDSLRATQLLARVLDTFQLTLPLRCIQSQGSLCVTFSALHAHDSGSVATF